MLEQISDERIYEKFVANSGEIEIGETEIRIDLKKKCDLPLLLDFFRQSQTTKYPLLKKQGFTIPIQPFRFLLKRNGLTIG